jgi:hypothetical protein
MTIAVRGVLSAVGAGYAAIPGADGVSRGCYFIPPDDV